MIGQTISHYRILEKLGEGGMGVVYKAHDTTLDRDVALKFLPGEYSSSEEEQSRFLHEAKAASALDHPNICTIYEVGTSPDGRLFIAMGYYEGTVLSRKIEKGRLDVAEAIGIAIQIAEGLQAAHEKGIIHRDIKSSNIIVSDKGQVRILDFGLARKKGLSKLTRTGTTVGTASYMSPEQARGDTIDHRTDIWSLGVVLYEMVTGRMPFRGEHEAAILYSVVNEQVQPLEATVANASPELIHIIGRALEKEVTERYQSAADMLIDLRRLRKETSRTGFRPLSSGKRRPLFSRNTKAIIGGVLVLLGLATYLYFRSRGVGINPNFTSRWVQVSYDLLGNNPALSPDGKWIIFGAEEKNKRWDLYVVNVGGGEARRLTQDSSDFAGCADVSPDGTTIVYSRLTGESYEMCLVPFIGGLSKSLGIGNDPKWSPDGKRIGFTLLPETDLPRGRSSKSGKGEFWTMNPDGSGKKLEFSDSNFTNRLTFLAYAWSPDGQSVAWMRKRKERYGEIVIRDLATLAERVVVADKTWKGQICWSSTGLLIYASSIGAEKNLFMVPATGGTPVQITKGLAYVDGPALSRDGRTLVFLQAKAVGHLWLAKLDGSGLRTEVKIGGEPVFEGPDVSPDGKYIAVGIRPLGTYARQIYVLNRDGSDIHQITTGDNVTMWPTWSPNGKRILYYARGLYEPIDSFKVYVVNAPKLDAPRSVSSGGGTQWVDSVTLGVYDQGKSWQVFVDGRARQQFSHDSIYAAMVGGGKYVYFEDLHASAIDGSVAAHLCRIEDWDGVGPHNARTLPGRDYYQSGNALYRRSGFDLYRISFRDSGIEKLKINLHDMDTLWSAIRTTSHGSEAIYSSSEEFKKLGVIENLFK